MAETKNSTLKRAKKPEEIGISSNAIKNIVEEFKTRDVEIHSLMILRHGKVAYESWAYPFTPEMPHIMYSVSKSFTSIAIGFAVEEGLISLDTKLVDIFPAFNNEKDEDLQQINIYHLLTMTAGKIVGYLTDRTKNQWIKDFFDAPWGFKPGERWEYISENQFMLSAIIKEVTGLSMREYLAPRLFAPLGIRENPYWECDGNGIEAGGWGLFITTEELARFCLCLLNKGKFKNKRVIPEKWVKFATDNLVDNSSEGYGACFWMNGNNRGYRADGMFSQFGMVFPEQDACLVMTSCEIEEGIAQECVWCHFDELFCEENANAKAAPAPLLETLADLPKSKIRSHFEDVIKDKKFTLKPSLALEAVKFPLSVLPIYTTFMSADRAGYYNDFEIDFDGDECLLTWNEDDERNTIRASLNGDVAFSPIHLGGVDFVSSASACWVNENNLMIWIRPLGAIGQRRLRFEFHDDGSYYLHSETSPDLNKIAKNLSNTVTKDIKSAITKNIVSSAFINVTPPILEPKHKLKMTDR